MANAQSILTLNGNQDTTQNSNDKMEIVSEINDTKEILEVNFTNNLEQINQNQLKTPSLRTKYNLGAYHTGSFCGVSNIDLNLITCEDKTVIPSIIQTYVLHLYHKYILHPGMDITEEMVRQNLYWPGIRYAVQKEVTDSDTL